MRNLIACVLMGVIIAAMSEQPVQAQAPLQVDADPGLELH